MPAWKSALLTTLCAFLVLPTLSCSCADFRFRSPKTGLVYELYITPSNLCRVETYAFIGGYTGGYTEVAPPMDYNVNCVDFGIQLEKQGFQMVPSVEADRTRSDVRPAQSGASANNYLWMLSATGPATAPVTDDAVYALDPNTLEIVASIPTPGPIPLGIVVNHGGTYVYATIQGVAAGQTGIPAHPPLIVVISTSSLAVVQTIDLPQGVNPGTPVLSPDDRYLYVPSAGTPSGVFVVDTQNPTSIATIPVTITTRSGNTEAVATNQGAITPDGALLFVMDSGVVPGGVYVIDTTTQQQIGELLLPSEQGLIQASQGMAVDPTGSRVYVLGAAGAGALTTYTGYVTAYSTATLTQIGSVTLKQGIYPSAIGMSLDGTTLYANDQNSSTIFSIDAVSLAVKEIDLPPPPAAPSGVTYQSSLLVAQ